MNIMSQRVAARCFRFNQYFRVPFKSDVVETKFKCKLQCSSCCQDFYLYKWNGQRYLLNKWGHDQSLVVMDHYSQASKSILCKSRSVEVDFIGMLIQCLPSCYLMVSGLLNTNAARNSLQDSVLSKINHLLKLFLLFHNVHSTVAKRSSSLLPAKISSKMSVKKEHAWSVLWFH